MIDHTSARVEHIKAAEPEQAGLVLAEDGTVAILAGGSGLGIKLSPGELRALAQMAATLAYELKQAQTEKPLAAVALPAPAQVWVN